MFRLYLIVQDVSTGLFLAQSGTGDVCFVPLVTQAGRFEDLEVAAESGETHCGAYVVFPFYQKLPDQRH